MQLRKFFPEAKVAIRQSFRLDETSPPSDGEIETAEHLSIYFSKVKNNLHLFFWLMAKGHWELRFAQRRARLPVVA